MELSLGGQMLLVLIGLSILVYIVLDDDDPSDGGPRRKRKLAPVRVRSHRTR